MFWCIYSEVLTFPDEIKLLNFEVMLGIVVTRWHPLCWLRPPRKHAVKTAKVYDGGAGHPPVAIGLAAHTIGP